MKSRNKERPKWTPERHAKIAETWRLRHAEEDALEIAGSKNTKRQGKICVYCGEKFDLREYVPTLRTRVKLPENHKIKFVLVPVCRECNHLLEYNEFVTVSQRRAHIKSILRARYAAFLEWQDYSEDEIYRELGHYHRDLIHKLNRAKQTLIRRLKYKEGE